MTIRQFDLASQHASLRERLDAAWTHVVSSGRFVLGGELDAFEHELASYLGGGYVVGVNSGSDALRLALHLHDIRPGDEVVLPSYTFRTTLEAVLQLRAAPKFVDCGDTGFNSSPAQIIAALSPRTRAVITASRREPTTTVPHTCIPQSSRHRRCASLNRAHATRSRCRCIPSWNPARWTMSVH